LETHCCRIDEAIGKWEWVVCSLEREGTIQANDLADLHSAGDLKRVILATLSQHFLEHLEITGRKRFSVSSMAGANEEARSLSVKYLSHPGESTALALTSGQIPDRSSYPCP
jgi:hypothetical protein